MAKRILVVSGTAKVGRALVEQLVASGEAVSAATRTPAAWSGPAGARAVRFDHGDPATWPAALDGADRVFLLVPSGTEAPDEVVGPFAAEASRRVSRVVLMTGAGVELDEQNPFRRLERIVERGPAPWVILRPTWFMDNFHTVWLPPIREAGVLAVPAGGGRTAFIDARDIAACAAGVLRSPDTRFDGRAFTLTGPESLSYADAAAVLARVAGRDIRHVDVDGETFTRALAAVGIPAPYAQGLIAALGAIRAGFAPPPSGVVAELSGRAPRSLAEYARDHASAWRQAAMPVP